MSADNYYVIKQNPETQKYHAIHGFMSNLEDGFPALAREGDEGYETWDDAWEAAYSSDSEYGLISEGGELDNIVTAEQARVWAENRILDLQEFVFYLKD